MVTPHTLWSPSLPPRALPLRFRAASARAGGAASINHLALIFPSPDPKPLPAQVWQSQASSGRSAGPAGARAAWILGLSRGGEYWAGGHRRAPVGAGGAESLPGGTMGAASQPPAFLGAPETQREGQTDQN